MIYPTSRYENRSDSQDCPQCGVIYAKIKEGLDSVYDDNGNLTHWDNGSISGTIDYDELNRKTEETINYGAFSKTTSTTYDHRSNKTSFTSPQGIVHSYEYQKNDHLQKISFDGQAIDLIQDKTRLTRINYGNGTATDYTYNDNSWLTTINTSNNATPILSRDYQFDPVGNINQIQSQQGTTSYTYDDIYQLTAADHPEATTITDEAYSYDQVGNRLTSAETSGTWSHNPNNELTDSTAATYTYDNNGNTIEKNQGGIITTYIYNSRNRLAQVLIDNIPIATYSYDPFGRRVSKTTNSATTYYLYADEGLIGEYSETGIWQKSYGWQPNSLWGTNPLYLRDNTGLYYYHNDHLGTPQRLTNATTGTTVWSAGYAAFGKATVDPLSTIDNNLRFPGQYYDSETNLHYNWNRTYDPQSGRYTQVDPIGFKGGINLYAYVGANPVKLLDPEGLFVAVSTSTNFGTSGETSSFPNADYRNETVNAGTAFGVSLDVMVGVLPDPHSEYTEVSVGGPFGKYLGVGMFFNTDECGNYISLGVTFHFGVGFGLPIAVTHTKPAHEYPYEGTKIPRDTEFKNPPPPRYRQ